MGNSLPPYVGRAVAESFVDALGVVPERPVESIELGDPELLVMENLRAAEYFDADRTRMPRNELRCRPPSAGEQAA